MRLEDVGASLYHVRTVATFRKADNEVETRETIGISTALKGRYLLTVDHAVTHYELTYETPFGTIVLPAEKISEETYLLAAGNEYPLRRVYSNREDDIAVFEVPSTLSLQAFPYSIGNSDDLRIGNFIYLVGNPLNTGMNVREGIVSALVAPDIVAKAEVKTENAFMVSNGLNPGDSGSPVLAIRDGKFELVGLSQGIFMVSQRMGWVIRINQVLRSIEEGTILHPVSLQEVARGLN
jgi:S1-C subfamily serine protease